MLSNIVYEYLLPTTLRSVCAATNSSSAHSLRGKSRYFFKSCLYSTIIHHHKWISCRTVQWVGGITLKKYLLSISGSSSVWRQSPEAKGGLISERFSIWIKSQKVSEFYCPEHYPLKEKMLRRIIWYFGFRYKPKRKTFWD